MENDSWNFVGNDVNLGYPSPALELVDSHLFSLTRRPIVYSKWTPKVDITTDNSKARSLLWAVPAIIRD